jgi:hypothetical protein
MLQNIVFVFVPIHIHSRPEYVSYVFLSFLASVTIYRLYKLTLSDHAHVTPQLTACLSALV